MTIYRPGMLEAYVLVMFAIILLVAVLAGRLLRDWPHRGD